LPARLSRAVVLPGRGSGPVSLGPAKPARPSELLPQPRRGHQPRAFQFSELAAGDEGKTGKPCYHSVALDSNPRTALCLD
jgi:hypothetical protein